MKIKIILLAAFVYAMLIFPALAEDFDDNVLFFEHWKHYDSQGIPCSACHTIQNGIFSLPGHKNSVVSG